MISNGPSRTFTQEAIESWFLTLSQCSWENFFNSESLKEGRNFYKNGVISSLDISSDQVIFIRKVNREETYSVIEWNGKSIDFRTSVDDEFIGCAIAVAGIYELEELIGEIHEIDPMLEEHDFSESVGLDSECISQEVEEKQQRAFNHNLIIKFEISSRKGLTATPFWENASGARTSPYDSTAKDISELVDRSKLMRFGREAVDFGFIFNKFNGAFVLESWNKVSKLVEEGLSTWGKAFCLEYVGDAELIKRGLQTVDWELEAKNKDTSSMLVKDAFRIDGKKINKNYFRGFTKFGQEPIFLSNYGLVSLRENQIDDFDWWKKNRGETQHGKWPRYMLFSLFARKNFQTRQDGELAKWQGTIRDLETKKPTIKIPFLRPYQLEGVTRINQLHSLGCHPLLADEMGLGKTMQALATLSTQATQKRNSLVVCPASVVPVWIKEVKSHFPKIKTQILRQGNNFHNISTYSSLWIASYTQLRRHRNLLENREFDYAILDEAQMIKNPKAKATQACLSIRAKHRLALTGTPIENSALDLWTIFRFLMPGLLGGKKELEKSLSLDATKTHAILQRQVSPFILRRLKKDVARDLPPKIEAEIPCKLNQEQATTYRKLAEQGILDHGENLGEAIRQSPTHLFSLLTRLRQTCCDLSLLPGIERNESSGIKGEILLQKLDDLSRSDTKAIVFSQFTSYLQILEKDISKRLPSIKLLKLTGATRDRAKPVEEFQCHPDSAIMLASLKAAGLGITLTAADYIFLMDPWWNPAVEEQAIDRAHRIGRQKPTFIYRLIAQGTIEERVRQLQISKKETFDEVIGTLEKPTRLSEYFSDLNELIKLEEIN